MGATSMAATRGRPAAPEGGPVAPVGRCRAGRAAGAAAPLAALLGLAALALAGCGQGGIERPGDVPTDLIVAYYQSPESFAEGIIKLDGRRVDREWGSEFTPERPYAQVRLSSEEGAGDPGAVRYAAVKAVYTDTHLYLLLEWPDRTADVLKDAFVFRGPGLADPIVRCREVGGVTVCDTTFRRGPQDSLRVPAWWAREGDDDKLALIFEIQETATGGVGFAERGCQVLCHPGAAMPFGTSDQGLLDVWYWLAGRTNPLRNLFNLRDDPSDPPQGLPGYLDDWYARPGAGLVPDPGWPAYMSNDPYDRGVPEFVYRRKDDPFFEPENPGSCRNRFGGECISNNGVSLAYLWRDSPNDEFAPFSRVDTLNQAIMPDMRPWIPGDLVPGHWMTYPSGSRADVRGKAMHNRDLGVWTLEVGRRLNTGDPSGDVIFDPASGRAYPFTLAVFDASTRRHWGSEPQFLVFQGRD